MPKASAVKQFDVRIDAYIAKAAPFAQPILTHVRELVHKTLPDVEETIKWSMPHFMYRGIILGNMAAFKEHCSFGEVTQGSAFRCKAATAACGCRAQDQCGRAHEELGGARAERPACGHSSAVAGSSTQEE
jgi:hypothetical protein